MKEIVPTKALRIKIIGSVSHLVLGLMNQMFADACIFDTFQISARSAENSSQKYRRGVRIVPIKHGTKLQCIVKVDNDTHFTCSIVYPGKMGKNRIYRTLVRKYPNKDCIIMKR